MAARMIKIFFSALAYSALIEVESAYFKGALSTLAYGHLRWWPMLITFVTIIGFAATLVHLIKRLDRMREPSAALRGTIDRSPKSAGLTIIAAALIALVASALVHLDESGVYAAQRHAGLIRLDWK